MGGTADEQMAVSTFFLVEEGSFVLNGERTISSCHIFLDAAPRPALPWKDPKEMREDSRTRYYNCRRQTADKADLSPTLGKSLTAQTQHSDALRPHLPSGTRTSTENWRAQEPVQRADSVKYHNRMCKLVFFFSSFSLPPTAFYLLLHSVENRGVT